MTAPTLPDKIVYEGRTFILGLHGIPDFYANSTLRWYWEEGTRKEDNRFLPETITASRIDLEGKE